MTVAVKLETPAEREKPPIKWAPELAQPIETPPAICDGLTIAPGRATTFAGFGGCRKGWFAHDLLICGAADLPLLGRWRMRAGFRGVYFDFEQTEIPTRKRSVLLCDGHGIDLAGLGQRFGYYWKPVPTLAPKTDADREKTVSALAWWTEGIDLAVIDAVRSCSPGIDENSVFASIPYDVCTDVSQRTGCGFVFVDHSGKPSETQAGRARLYAQRGHSSKIDSSQTQFMFTAGKGQPTRVSCERSQLFDEDAWPDDFRFTLGRTDNGGLRLVEVDPPEAEEQTDEQKFAKLCDRVFDVIAHNPGITEKDEIAKRVGVKAYEVRGAISALEREGRVENRGRGKGYFARQVEQ